MFTSILSNADSQVGLGDTRLDFIQAFPEVVALRNQRLRETKPRGERKDRECTNQIRESIRKGKV
jgi:hypothetical protein